MITHIVQHLLPDVAKVYLLDVLQGPSTWKAANRLGFKWLGWGEAYDPTPHDFTHGQAK